MTVSSTTTRADLYVGNNQATAFPFPFKVYAPEHLVVIQTDSSGRETVLVLNQHYTVSLLTTGGKVKLVLSKRGT